MGRKWLGQPAVWADHPGATKTAFHVPNCRPKESLTCVDRVLYHPHPIPNNLLTVRNPGGIVPETGGELLVGDAANIQQSGSMLLLLTTENLSFLDMTDGQQYYVTGWAAGAYDVSGGQIVNQLHPEFTEPIADFEARVAAVLQGLPDPKPVSGLPLFDTDAGSGIVP